MALLIRRGQLDVWLCLLLLLAVASPAPMVVADGECYYTAMHVPKKCRAEFIRALWNNDPDGISPKCCLKLVCVHDDACFRVLSNLCDYGTWIRYCKWDLSSMRTSNSSKPAPPPLGHRH